MTDTQLAPVADWVTIADLYRDPFPIYDRLRAEGGVHWVPSVGRYLITSYDAVHVTEFDQETFSANEEGSLQIRAMGHSMLRRDDPEHYVERKAWEPVLRPGVVKRVWTEVFERNAQRYLDEMIERGPGADLIWDFAAPYAAENLREIIGLHNVTQQDMQRWSQTLIDATGNYADDPEVWAKGKRSFDEVDDALDEMLAWHAKNPSTSLLSSLLSMPGETMPLERIRANVKMTIGGGLNEPRDALGVAAWALLTHPEQRRAAEADPSLWPVVFDETIRWIAPIGLYSRQTTREVELAGVTLPARAKLGICILSANRDERVWTDADRFDIHREVKPHLAFSKGVHVCLGAWVARAEVAGVGLPRLFERLRGVELIPQRPAEIGGWVFRGMLSMPVQWDTRAPAAAPPEAAPQPSIAVVGSGPAGCFTTQALRRRFPEARIDVYDAMPVPYGLARYGVAADHQGTKSVTRQFDRLFLQEGVRFVGNTPVDAQRLTQLRAECDVVVLATGVSNDAPLPVSGAELPGVIGAGAFTRAMNSHPQAAAVPPLGERVVVVGQGNVAMDVVRLLARGDAGWEGSDIADEARAAAAAQVREVHVVGRTGPAEAKFDPVMVREIAGLARVAHTVHGVDLGVVPVGKDARWDSVRELAKTRPADAAVHVHWWFGLSPARIEGDSRVERVVFDSLAGEQTIAASAVITAVGFRGDGLVPAGAHPEGRVADGLYVAGWLRSGPRGTIPDQRADARTLAALIADDVAVGRVVAGKPGARPPADSTDFDGWRRIDMRERAGAAIGRVRAKLRAVDEMLAVARDLSVVLPEAAAAAGEVAAGELPVTILYGTESGNAELVADDLARMLASRADVQVHDMAEVDAAELDHDRFHLVVCSTYGDGEVPTTARPFHAQLRSGAVDLAGLRYGVFGLGDRSYTHTYSRGSEMIDEALSACGAQRVGEYGRHDAGGQIDAVDAARDWCEGVAAEYVEGALTSAAI